MFPIGEFSRIARVSGRLLRYYDQLGLLTPEVVDSRTGYRYYAAAQLPQLNRILALKELGLSLEQVRDLLREDVSTEALRGMLRVQQAEAERALAAEQARLARIAARLEQLDRGGALPTDDVRIKPVPAGPALTVRDVFPDMAQVVAQLGELLAVVPKALGARGVASLLAVVHDEVFEPEQVDVELGFLLPAPLRGEPPALPGGRVLRGVTLPAETMATVVRAGHPEREHLATGAIAHWLEANGYRLAGPNREVFLERPDVGRMHEAVVEMQFAVAPQAATP